MPNLEGPSEEKKSPSEDSSYADRLRSQVFGLLKEFAILITVFGIPTAAAAFGFTILYPVAFGVSGLSDEIKVFVAVLLILFGLASQLWLYARQNPPSADEVLRLLLEQNNDLVSKIISMQSGQAGGNEDE
jgi:hypothetical protein